MANFIYSAANKVAVNLDQVKLIRKYINEEHKSYTLSFILEMEENKTDFTGNAIYVPERYVDWVFADLQTLELTFLALSKLFKVVGI